MKKKSDVWRQKVRTKWQLVRKYRLLLVSFVTASLAF